MCVIVAFLRAVTSCAQVLFLPTHASDSWRCEGTFTHGSILNQKCADNVQVWSFGQCALGNVTDNRKMRNRNSRRQRSLLDNVKETNSVPYAEGSSGL